MNCGTILYGLGDDLKIAAGRAANSDEMAVLQAHHRPEAHRAAAALYVQQLQYRLLVVGYVVRPSMRPLHDLSGLQPPTYADVTGFPAQTVALTEESAVTFRRYRPPPALDRGACAVCGGPVVEFMALGPLKMFAFVPSQNFERPSELPKPSLHIFYDRRVADATDALPKVSG
jgi:hypothetical protein